MGFRLIYLCVFLISSHASAFNVGFNQAWWKNNYEHQWTNPSYQASEVRRILDLNSDAGSQTLRVWLFEGQNSTALIWKNKKVVGLHTDFLRNFEDFLRAAKKRNIKVYLTLFDGNQLRTLQKGPYRTRWWNLLNNHYGAQEAFANNALVPLLKILYKPEHRSIIFGIDLMNEIDATVSGWEFENSWTGANQFICNLRSTIRKHRANQAPIPATASIGWPKIPFYSRGAANLILEPNPHPSCVDFWDIHFYNNEGSIPNCEKIRRVSRQYRKKIFLGEFGQESKSYSDELQLESTRRFIANAKYCGFSGALAWRLSDIRSGDNPEARFSFEAHGKTRPAYDFIKAWNQHHQ